MNDTAGRAQKEPASGITANNRYFSCQRLQSRVDVRVNLLDFFSLSFSFPRATLSPS